MSLHYKLVKEIEKGGNSTVWSVRGKNNELYACKIPLDSDLSEVNTMSQISKYPNTVMFLTFYGIYEHN